MTVNTPLVYGGGSIHFPWATAERGYYMKLIPNMLAHYPGLPDYRTLYTDEVRGLYESLRSTLEKITEPTRQTK